jgi:cysteine-rich repeat protein
MALGLDDKENPVPRRDGQADAHDGTDPSPDDGRPDLPDGDLPDVDVPEQDAPDVEIEIPPGCGDGDVGSGEECDDGNGIPGDGCEPDCTFSCHIDADCDDGIPCTQSACNGSHVCTYQDGFPMSDVDSIDAGEFHTCAVASGNAYCWGSNGCGQIGDGTYDRRLIAVPVIGLSDSVLNVSAGYCHSCAAKDNYRAMCWGDNGDGQLGDGSTEVSPSPVAVYDGDATSVSAGYGHTCLRTTEGAIRCWGSNLSGQLGDGTENDSLVPVDVEGMTASITSVVAGLVHTCASRWDPSGLWCWGGNEIGQLGDGTIDYSNVPVAVLSLQFQTTSLSSSDSHTCVTDAEGIMECWGDNSSGQLGAEAMEAYSSHWVEVEGLRQAAFAAAGGTFTCALRQEGDVVCWGANDRGQLGDGSGIDSELPVTVALPAAAFFVTAGEAHACAVLAVGGEVYCWGANVEGQLGDGTTVDRLSPVQACTSVTPE